MRIVKAKGMINKLAVDIEEELTIAEDYCLVLVMAELLTEAQLRLRCQMRVPRLGPA